MTTPPWWVYHGTGKPHEWEVPPASRWRTFDGTPPAGGRPTGLGWLVAGEADARVGRRELLAKTYRAEHGEALLVNAAIYLRRPLLVTGGPGVGKSTLAGSIAYELKLGEVLHWPITSRTTLQDGLYRYDAVGRLHAANLDRQGRRPGRGPADVGRYLTLGPLGTALLPADRPRVLLIDEFDKGDIDLANDLLTVFEEGRFPIPELQRMDDQVVTVLTADAKAAAIERGRVECAQFPIVVITSNGERQFPPAFMRRCVKLRIDPPSATKLRRIVQAHLGSQILQKPGMADLLEVFAEKMRKPDAVFATDQLLNVLSLESDVERDSDDWKVLVERLLSPLDDQT